MGVESYKLQKEGRENRGGLKNCFSVDERKFGKWGWSFCPKQWKISTDINFTSKLDAFSVKKKAASPRMC